MAESLLEARCPGSEAGGGAAFVAAAGRALLDASTEVAEAKGGKWCGQAQQVEAEFLDVSLLHGGSQKAGSWHLPEGKHAEGTSGDLWAIFPADLLECTLADLKECTLRGGLGAQAGECFVLALLLGLDGELGRGTGEGGKISGSLRSSKCSSSSVGAGAIAHCPKARAEDAGVALGAVVSVGAQGTGYGT